MIFFAILLAVGLCLAGGGVLTFIVLMSISAIKDYKRYGDTEGILWMSVVIVLIMIAVGVFGIVATS